VLAIGSCRRRRRRILIAGMSRILVMVSKAQHVRAKRDPSDWLDIVVEGTGRSTDVVEADIVLLLDHKGIEADETDLQVGKASCHHGEDQQLVTLVGSG
jgi:hypothetical protein